MELWRLQSNPITLKREIHQMFGTVFSTKDAPPFGQRLVPFLLVAPLQLSAHESLRVETRIISVLEWAKTLDRPSLTKQDYYWLA